MTPDSQPLLRQVSSVESETDMTGFEHDFHADDMLIHRYPRSRSYRLSGMSPPQIGDIARCGHVKAIPHMPVAEQGGAPHCHACDRLAALAGVR